MNATQLLIRNSTRRPPGMKPSPVGDAKGSEHLALKRMAASLLLAFGANALALPTGGVVAEGGATIGSTAGSTVITQSSQNVAINWQSFSIGQGETVQFIQPNSSSVALNRVLGADPSVILGNLSANGKVFLLNPNGILFGIGAQVNVGGLVASTLAMSDSDFMAGRYQLAGDSTATILNQGTINADGGYVALLGANVSNEGIIVARLGSVTLAAGSAATLDVAGDGLLNVTVSQGAINALAQNGGLIQADGGQVLLSAKAAGNLLLSAVNNTGVIQAQTIVNRKGSVMLLGDMDIGTVNVSGTIDVSGQGTGLAGGSATLTAHHVGLFDAHINASGDVGGGSVLVGGDYQGTNPAVANATATYMSAGSTITADAITNGKGGKVILWGNESTRAYGSITARGGALGGDGGLIETSAHWLDVVGISVSASAPNGNHGLWLLDPADVTIGAGTVNATLAGGVFTPNSGVGAATVDVAALRAALEAGTGTNITITTTNSGAPGVPASGLGNITVASALTYTPTTSATLTLNATGDVNINAAITTNKGNLVVCCGQDINVNALITTTNGSVLLSAGRDVNILRIAPNNTAGITTTDGNIAICAGRDINLNNTVNPGTTLMTLTRGSVTAGEDLATLGVARGLTLMAGFAGTGPGAAGGTVKFTNGGLAGTFITTTGPDPVTPTNIYYNPSSYATPTNYSTFFTGTGSPLTQYMLVFPDGANKTADGTTVATFTGLKGSPAGVTLTGAGTANFDTAAVGANKTISFTGFTLTQAAITTGGAGINYAFASTCCAPIVRRTTATITAALPVVPIPVVSLANTPAEELMGGEEDVTADTTLGILPSLMPRVDLAALPPQLQRITPVVEQQELAVPPEAPPPLYVPPLRLRKQDRN